MGTNYYHHTDPCPTCGHYEIRHIGKSSAGWAFVFRGYDDVASFQDWRRILTYGGTVVDQYDREVKLRYLLDLVAAKRDHANHAVQYPGPTTWLDDEGHPFNGHEFC